MKKLFTLFLLMLAIQVIQAQVKYSKLKVHIDNSGVEDLIRLGIDIDHGIYEEGKFYTADFSDTDIDILNSAEIHYEILVDDVVAHFHYENEHPTENVQYRTDGLPCFATATLPAVPSHWYLGSMGGYFTYAQMLQMIDSMALEYPGLITVKTPLSTMTTAEGRSVFVVKISDNPNVSEASEPKVLYTALHHAREPLSMSQLIMYMYYVLENYNTDLMIKSIVDNSEMYFVPCLNPDGYIYNQTTNPSGGGMWRKNRRNNGDGTFGVDLNRNYGFYWAYDDVGSSPTTSSDTYRGTAGFSEPETKMIRDFVSSVPFEIVLNYHTYGNYLVYPWGHIPSLTPDSTLFKRYGAYLTEENKYKAGTGFETVGYNVNGDSDDYGYGDSITKNKYFSMTPECGDAFWMPSSQITATCQGTLMQNIKTALLVIDVADLEDINTSLFTTTNGFLKYDIERLGLRNTDTFKVECISLSPALTVATAPKYHINMALLQKNTDSVSYTINPSLLTGNTFRYLWKLTTNNVSTYDTIIKYFDDSLIRVYASSATTLSGWTNSGTRNWGVSATTYVSAPASFHDSPTGNSENNATYILTNNTVFDLTNANNAFLKFYCKWATEDNYDFVQVHAVEEVTNIATPLCGLYTVEGTADEDLGNPVYDGTQATWVQENMNLSDFLGKKIKIRFTLKTDNFTRLDGFYFDDIEILVNTDTTNTDSTNVGIQDISKEAFQIYPSITQDEITILSKYNKQFNTIQILDQIGNIVVAKNNIAEKSYILDVRNLSNGIYYLKVADFKNQYQTFKFVKY
jgi:hypothetical protein